ncbi:DUF2254 domain-containing protein [Arthrobacter sp. Br18]|uniref:DUF2254 domain-containing protein n=1 Tax=Arthrobacter sp. Br18 TaxID=1312954 RepID=UPI0004B2BAA1|nr:DUF2254 domain-containing protein [Arthrobacter sp. Br18]
MQRFQLKHWLKTSLWVIPVLFILGGISLSLITTAVDPEGTVIPQQVSGDPTAAIQILHLISFAMLTLTGLVLSLLVLVVQLAMGSFSPRIVRQILQDRPSQAAIGLFAGTFTHSMLSMRVVRTTPEGGTVPGLAVLIAIILVIGCIVTLVWYLNHIGQSLRVAALVDWLAKDTMATLRNVYPDSGDGPEVAKDVIVATQGGILFDVDHDELIQLATDADCRIDLLWAIGDFVPTNAALIRIMDGTAGLSRAKVSRAVVLGQERTMNQDVAYGIRMLVDIAAGALASGPFDDPTTAVQAIDRLHDILRQIVRRPLHSGEFTDPEGTPRLTVPVLQWHGFVRLAFDEIRIAGTESPQVTRRLNAALTELLTVAPSDRRAPLEHQRGGRLPEAGLARGGQLRGDLRAGQGAYQSVRSFNLGAGLEVPKDSQTPARSRNLDDAARIGRTRTRYLLDLRCFEVLLLQLH